MFMFSKKATKIFTLDWQYVVNVKSTVKILSIYVAFLENVNFTNVFCDGMDKTFWIWVNFKIQKWNILGPF